MSKLIVNKKVFVRPETKNKAVNNLIMRIEKLTSIYSWLSKSAQYLELYKRTLDESDKSDDEAIRYMGLVNCEAYFMTAVMLYTRCYRDRQKGPMLRFGDITKEAELTNCHNKLETLRHDEYVHWKGLRSSLKVYYSFEQVDNKIAKFAQDMHVEFKEKLGPDSDYVIVHRLFDEVMKYVSLQRIKLLKKMEKIFEKDEVRSVTRLLDIEGCSIFSE